jgi:hypothetical protein
MSFCLFLSAFIFSFYALLGILATKNYDSAMEKSTRFWRLGLSGLLPTGCFYLVMTVVRAVRGWIHGLQGLDNWSGTE